MSFRASPILRKNLSSASRSWLSRQSRDPYVKLRNASPNVYRSRSAFKLLELNAAWGSFLSRKDVRAVVDLGAAPGGWSQVVSEKLGWIDSATPDWDDSDVASEYGLQLGRVPGPERNLDASSSWRTKQGRGVIVSVDLLPITPIPGVHAMQMDFLDPQAGAAIKAVLSTPENPSGVVDIILSDMAANFSGYKTRDVESSLDICHSIFNFAKDNLRVRDSPQEATKRHRGGTLL
ncbi:FtsJ-like methyltransferase-domain-containing protein [Boletus reticuloceps]|uniref:rRNA methyltransferase 2, mitochondrial n=1 Tax=Boletus reticuloceps TaxID=495285 RepID=A0A8I3A6Q4_9AGAM|nr:FtsJ-like methyltransferase-domain-containing protein [Boletus reticuloceps]